MTLTQVLSQDIVAEAAFNNHVAEVQRCGEDGYNVMVWNKSDLSSPEQAASVATRRDAENALSEWYGIDPDALEWS